MAGDVRAKLQKYSCLTDGGCIRWTGSVMKTGYGRVSVNGINMLAHRVAYEHEIGPIPSGLVLDHLCRNRWCINPQHLEPVTITENILRGVGTGAKNKRKTHCIYGHDLSDAYRYPHGRVCRKCRALKYLRYKLKQKETKETS